MPAVPITVTTLYNGEITIEFFEKPFRKYVVNGEKKPSVTTITGQLQKPGLVPWAAKVTVDYILQQMESGMTVTPELLNEAKKQHTIKKEEGADLGTQIHSWAESHIGYMLGHNPKPSLPDSVERPQLYNGVTAFLDWVHRSNVKFVSSERNIYSRQYEYAGKMDAEAIIDGKLCVIDFKTANVDKRTGKPVIYNEMRYQTAAYQYAAMEEGTEYTGDRHIIHFNKQTGDFSVHPLNNIELDFEGFKALRMVKRIEEQLKEQSR